MTQTYRDTFNVERCRACLRPMVQETGFEALYAAAKRALRYFDRHTKGIPQSDYEDILAGRELQAAVDLVEQEQREKELVDRR